MLGLSIRMLAYIETRCDYLSIVLLNFIKQQLRNYIATQLAMAVLVVSNALCRSRLLFFKCTYACRLPFPFLPPPSPLFCGTTSSPHPRRLHHQPCNSSPQAVADMPAGLHKLDKAEPAREITILHFNDVYEIEASVAKVYE